MFKLKKATLKDEMKVRHGTYFTYGDTLFKVMLFGDIVKLAFYDEQSGVISHLSAADYTLDFVQQAVLKGSYKIIEPVNGEIMIPDKLRDYVIQIEDKSKR